MPGASSQRRPCQRHLCIGSQALQFSHIGAWPAKVSRWPSATVSLASNIFLIALCHSAAILFAMALPASSSATAPLLATNLIRRRRVLRFGYQSGAPGPDLLTRSFGVRPFIAPIHISARLPCCHLATAART